MGHPIHLPVAQVSLANATQLSAPQSSRESRSARTATAARYSSASATRPSAQLSLQQPAQHCQDTDSSRPEFHRDPQDCQSAAQVSTRKSVLAMSAVVQSAMLSVLPTNASTRPTLVNAAQNTPVNATPTSATVVSTLAHADSTLLRRPSTPAAQPPSVLATPARSQKHARKDTQLLRQATVADASAEHAHHQWSVSTTEMLMHQVLPGWRTSAPSAHAVTHQTPRASTRPVAPLSSAVPAVRDTLTSQLPVSAAEIAFQLCATTKASSTHRDRHGPTQRTLALHASV